MKKANRRAVVAEAQSTATPIEDAALNAVIECREKLLTVAGNMADKEYSRGAFGITVKVPSEHHRSLRKASKAYDAALEALEDIRFVKRVAKEGRA